MEIQERERELLLGYLLNALDDREVAQVERELARQPHLRSELAILQRDLSPLNYMGDPVEPPPQLASRTCAKIWDTLDNDEQDCPIDSGTFLDSAFYSPESVLPTHFLARTSDSSDEIESVPTKIPKKIEIDNKENVPRSSHWISLVASVSVGIIIAFFLFPMIEYTKRSTRSYVTESWMSEINRRVDQYEQIHSNQNNIPQIEEIFPFNLALSGWQELYSETLMSLPFLPTKPAISFKDMIVQVENTPHKKQISNEIFRGQERYLLPDFDKENKSIPLDTNGIPNHMLLLTPGQENSVRSAFGQDILLKDGRIFFRILPNAEPPKK